MFICLRHIPQASTAALFLGLIENVRSFLSRRHKQRWKPMINSCWLRELDELEVLYNGLPLLLSYGYQKFP